MSSSEEGRHVQPQQIQFIQIISFDWLRRRIYFAGIILLKHIFCVLEPFNTRNPLTAKTCTVIDRGSADLIAHTYRWYDV